MNKLNICLLNIECKVCVKCMLNERRNMKLGELIYNRRIELGFSQSVTAKKLGITRTRLSQIECGKAKKLNMETMVKISNFIQKPTTYVVKLLQDKK